MTMTGKFESLFNRQKMFQEIIEHELPFDDPKRFQYHMNAMVEELGEVLKADKRWKTHRNTTFNREEKLDELSDCFITLLNIALWSNFTQDELLDGIDRKIAENFERIKLEGEKK